MAAVILAAKRLDLDPPVGLLRSWMAQCMGVQEESLTRDVRTGWQALCAALDDTTQDDPAWCTLEGYRGTIGTEILAGTLTKADRDWIPFTEDVARRTFLFGVDDVVVGLGLDAEAGDGICDAVR